MEPMKIMKLEILIASCLIFSSQISHADEIDTMIELSVSQMRTEVDLGALSTCLGVSESEFLQSFSSSIRYCADQYGMQESNDEAMNSCFITESKKRLKVSDAIFDKCEAKFADTEEDGYSTDFNDDFETLSSEDMMEQAKLAQQAAQRASQLFPEDKAAVVDKETLALINELNTAMGKLADIVQSIQALNENDKVLSGFFQQMQQQPNADEMKVAGDNTRYPVTLKNSYDNQVDVVFSAADEVIKKAYSSQSGEGCSNKIQGIQAKLSQIEPVIRKSQQLSVGNAKSRAEAYLSLGQTMPLGLVVAELAMAFSSSCSIQ
jgi:hypothetical protein